MSSLDKTENISKDFNKAGDVELEKKLSDFQFTKDEQQEVFDLRKNVTSQIQQEKDSFKNPEEFDRRLQTKFEELSKNNKPTLEYTVKGPQQNIPNHQLLQIADREVRTDHKSNINNFNKDYHNGMNTVLNRASEEGRGPQTPELNQNQETDKSLTQEFNREH